MTWALAQLVSWGCVYYSFSLLVVPMEQTMGWSRTATNAALSVGLLVSGFAAYPIGRWIDHGLGRRVMIVGSIIAAAMLLLWANTHSLTVLFVVWIGLGISMAATFYDPVFAVVTHRDPRSFRTKITLMTLGCRFCEYGLHTADSAPRWRTRLAHGACRPCSAEPACLPTHPRAGNPFVQV